MDFISWLASYCWKFAYFAWATKSCPLTKESVKTISIGQYAHWILLSHAVIYDGFREIEHYFLLETPILITFHYSLPDLTITYMQFVSQK